MNIYLQTKNLSNKINLYTPVKFLIVREKQKLKCNRFSFMLIYIILDKLCYIDIFISNKYTYLIGNFFNIKKNYFRNIVSFSRLLYVKIDIQVLLHIC